jgi:hypothetical protein
MSSGAESFGGLTKLSITHIAADGSQLGLMDKPPTPVLSDMMASTE